jgi:hypothetical protein
MSSPTKPPHLSDSSRTPRLPGGPTIQHVYGRGCASFKSVISELLSWAPMALKGLELLQPHDQGFPCSSSQRKIGYDVDNGPAAHIN